MTHVWQHQKGAIMRKGFINIINNDGSITTSGPAGIFDLYNILIGYKKMEFKYMHQEGQAQMVAIYFLEMINNKEIYKQRARTIFPRMVHFLNDPYSNANLLRQAGAI